MQVWNIFKLKIRRNLKKRIVAPDFLPILAVRNSVSWIGYKKLKYAKRFIDPYQYGCVCLERLRAGPNGPGQI